MWSVGDELDANGEKWSGRLDAPVRMPEGGQFSGVFRREVHGACEGSWEQYVTERRSKNSYVL
jgi:hypothetical protein